MLSKIFASKEKKLITESQLRELIIDLYHKKTKEIDWKVVLEKNGYLPVLKNINLSVEKLHQLGLTQPLLNAFFVKGIFKNISIENCQNIELLFKKATVHNCKFVNSSIKQFLEMNFKNCFFDRVDFTRAIILDCSFTKVEMNHCLFQNAIMRNISLENFIMKGCNVYSSRFIEIKSNASETDLGDNNFDTNCVFQETPWDRTYPLLTFKIDSSRPNVVFLFSPADGVTNASLLVEYLQQKKLNVILVTPEIGLAHPIFNTPTSINAIVLPGGTDVPLDDSDLRKNFELHLLSFASDSEIPTLCICRAHQLALSRYGARIEDLSRHPEFSQEHVEGIDLVVENEPNSFLHSRLDRYHEDIVNSNQLSPLTKDEKGNFIFKPICAHNQFAFFESNKDIPANIKILAKSKKGVIEACQINGHIVTYLHHHEALMNMNSPRSKIAETILEHFVLLTEDFYYKTEYKRNKNNP